MKKKPIYLWVLLILSALISVPSLFGIVSPLPSKEALRTAQKQVAGVNAQQLEDQLNYTYRVAEASHSIFNPNHSYLSQLDVTYKTPDLMSHFLPPHEVSFTFCCSSIVFPR